MTRIVTAKQMKAVDVLATKRFGIPALLLMENAGRSAVIEALKMLPKNCKARVAIFCGYGNNGGDGFVCARHLINKGIRAQVYLVGKKKKFSRETDINYYILRKMKQKFKLIKSAEAAANLKNEIKNCRLIIDGIFGIGLKGKLDEFYKKLFHMLNISKVPILALDIPSGLDADTGKCLGSALCAKKTVTFGLLKKGLVKKQARKFTGKIIIGDISLPR
ncbi:MAG: NAD(P)H-hydrate epimerase [Candidatus Omnitrophica bacterium]|nr:NAD(P)H-hydrate epimerase [Candidatus Omnitrophota bacterium]